MILNDFGNGKLWREKDSFCPPLQAGSWHINQMKDVSFSPFFASYPGSSVPTLGHWVSEWLTATLELWNKEQFAFETKRQKYKKNKRQKDKKVEVFHLFAFFSAAL